MTGRVARERTRGAFPPGTPLRPCPVGAEHGDAEEHDIHGLQTVSVFLPIFLGGRNARD